MRFEGRELKDYAEPVSPDRLKIGSIYFSVTYTDNMMQVPTVETVAFVGANQHPDAATLAFFGEGENDEDLILFQDAESFYKGVTYESATPNRPATFHTCLKSEVGDVFEYEHALDELIKCSLNRGGQGTRSGRYDHSDRSGMDRNIPIIFGEREMELCPEPVPVGELREDSVYFSFTCLDAARNIPVMKTLVFSGERGGFRVFQDIHSHREGIRYDSFDGAKEYALFYKYPKDKLHEIFDFDHVLEEWMRCSIRRRHGIMKNGVCASDLDASPKVRSGHMKSSRTIQFEDAQLQKAFLAEMEGTGVSYRLDAGGAVLFDDTGDQGITDAAHRVRDTLFPWYFLKWKTEKESNRFREVLVKTGLSFIVENHEDGTWFVVRRADQEEIDRLSAKVMWQGE